MQHMPPPHMNDMGMGYFIHTRACKHRYKHSTHPCQVGLGP